MTPRVPFLFAVVALVLAQARAWVSRTEMVAKRERISLTGLRAKAQDGDDDTISIEAYRERLERRFNVFGDHAHDFFCSSSVLYDEDEEWIESEWPDESTLACGDDCEVSGSAATRVCTIAKCAHKTLLTRFVLTFSLRNVKYRKS